METGVRRSGPKLSWTLTLRIIAASALILCAQVLACVYENLSDHRYFSTHYIAMEIHRLGKGVYRADGRLAYDMGKAPGHFRGPFAYHYAFRVSDINGTVLAASNSQVMENALAATGRGPVAPYAWYRKLESGDWFHVAGGEPFSVDRDEVWIEFATLGDPAFQRLWALAAEFTKDVWIPSLPLIVSMLLFVMLTVGRSLRPVVNAARQVESIDANTVQLGISHAELPHEIAILTRAIEKQLLRNSDLIAAQRRLLAHSAHELRTPLSMMLLEISNLKGNGAARLAEDVRSMTAIVNNLLSIARLDAIAALPDKPIDLTEIVDRVVKASSKLLASRNCSIEVLSRDPVNFKGDPTSIYDAARNLLENAVKHTQHGAKIRITCGPGSTLKVEDSGAGFPTSKAPELLFEPFAKGDASKEGSGLGLAIVKKALDLHAGTIEVGRSNQLGGASVEVGFAAMNGV